MHLVLALLLGLTLADRVAAQPTDYGCRDTGKYVGIVRWKDGEQSVVRTRQRESTSHYPGIGGTMRCKGAGCLSRRGRISFWSSLSIGHFSFRDGNPRAADPSCNMILEPLDAPPGCLRCGAEFACNPQGLPPSLVGSDGTIELISYRCRDELLP